MYTYSSWKDAVNYPKVKRGHYLGLVMVVWQRSSNGATNAYVKMELKLMPQLPMQHSREGYKVLNYQLVYGKALKLPEGPCSCTQGKDNRMLSGEQ